MKQVTAKSVKEVLNWVETNDHHIASWSKDGTVFTLEGRSARIRIPVEVQKLTSDLIIPGDRFDRRMYRASAKGRRLLGLKKETIAELKRKVEELENEKESLDEQLEVALLQLQQVKSSMEQPDIEVVRLEAIQTYDEDFDIHDVRFSGKNKAGEEVYLWVPPEKSGVTRKMFEQLTRNGRLHIHYMDLPYLATGLSNYRKCRSWVARIRDKNRK